MFLDKILDMFLLVMQGIVTLIPPVIPDSMKDVLRTVRISLLWEWNVSKYSSSLGCFVELLPGLSVPLEDRNLKVPEKMERIENSQLS